MQNLNQYIDYTQLRYCTSKAMKQFVKIANERNYYGVCILPSCIDLVKKHANPDMQIISIAGFPPQYAWDEINKISMGSLSLGYYGIKNVYKLHEVINNPNLDELDMVFPILWYSTGKKLKITKFLTGVKKRFKKKIKCIVELGTVFKKKNSWEDINKILVDSNIDMVKSNSGILKQNFETLYDYLKYAVDVFDMPFKASGSIKTKEQVEQLIELGVKRIGTSKDVLNEKT